MATYCVFRFKKIAPTRGKFYVFEGVNQHTPEIQMNICRDDFIKKNIPVHCINFDTYYTKVSFMTY